MNTKKSPPIRFKGFIDDWEQHKLKELAIFSKGNGYTKNDLKEIGTPIVLYGRLYTKYETIIEEVDTFVEVQDKSVISEGNEVVVPASGESAEDISRASVIGKPGFILGGDLNIIKPKQEINPVFLALTISSGTQQKEMSKRAQGKSVVHLRISDLEEVNLIYPIIEEQKQIGTFFTNIDKIITLHQRKLELLKDMKKSMLQKMFPKEGATVPEIRFAGFIGDWEERKLGDVLKRRQITQLVSEDAPRLAFASGQGVIPLSERKTNNRDQLISDETTKKYLLTEIDDIVYNPANLKYGAIDRNKYGKGVISPIYVTFTTQEEASFIERIVTNKNFISKALRFEEGSVTKRQSVNYECLLSLEVMSCPSREEQVKIGNFFQYIDDLTTTQQKELNLLKDLKKSMLQKIFI